MEEARHQIDLWIAHGNPQKTLTIERLPITSLPPIPLTVRHLALRKLKITEVKWLPPSLATLDITECPLKTLCSLPPTIESLCIGWCPLSRLPPLPPRLLVLYCFNTEVSEIPEIPPMVVGLSLHTNPKLLSLPPIPPSVDWITIRNTNIRVLPPLHPTFRVAHTENCPHLLVHMDGGDSESYRARWAEVLDIERWVPRMKLIKEELMSIMWHPARVQYWMHAGGRSLVRQMAGNDA